MTSYVKYTNSISVLSPPPTNSLGTPSQPPPPSISSINVNKPNITQYDHDVDVLLHAISPTYETNEMRSSIINYIKRIFQHYSVGCTVAMGGSFPLKVYLPESDLDVVVLTRQSSNENDDLKDILDIFSCLCRAINESEKIIPPNGIYEDIKIQRIEFINARIKVVKCVINQTSLDITANQKSSLASATFLEEADRIIGWQHLYKRSVILIKAWCLHESSKYSTCNSPIIGAKVGMFSSYAISILILYLFNILPIDDSVIPTSSQFGIHSTSLGLLGNDSYVLPFQSISHPLHVLRAFLYIYSRFQWDSFVFSLDGPVSIRNGTLGSSSVDASHSISPSPAMPTVNNLFKEIADQVRESYNSQDNISKVNLAYRPPHRFSLRYFNIVDPVDITNNLGISVTLKNSKTIQSVLTNASQHMESLYAWWYQNGSRPTPNFSSGNSNPNPTISVPRPSYGTPLSIAPGLSSNTPTHPSPTAANISPMNTSLPIAASSVGGYPASSPFLPPLPIHAHQYAGSIYHSAQIPPNFVASQYQYPPKTNDLCSFLTLFFPQSLTIYQSVLHNAVFPRRSLPGSTSNLAEHEADIKSIHRVSPPRKERSASYNAFSTESSLNPLTTALSQTAQDFDNLNSDIELMWDSLKHIPASPSRLPPIDTDGVIGSLDSPRTPIHHPHSGDISDSSSVFADMNLDIEVESGEDTPINSPHVKSNLIEPQIEPLSKVRLDELNNQVEPIKGPPESVSLVNKSENTTKDAYPTKSADTLSFLSLSNVFLSVTLSVLLFIFVGFLNGGSDSSELNLTTLTQKFFCSTENLSLPLAPTSPLPPSPPMPIVQATLLEKENVPAYQYLPESEIQTTEIWVLPNQHLTLGLNSYAQDIYYDSTLRKNISGVWLQDQYIYRSSESGCCVTTPHLMLTSLDRPGFYQYVLYDQYAHLRRDDNLRESKSSLNPLFSCCIKPEGDPAKSIAENMASEHSKDHESLIHSSSLSQTLMEKKDILRVLSKSFVKLAVPPSSKTKPKHLTLTAGASQLYLHVQPEGVPPPSLQWYRNGVLLPSETKNILVVNEVNKSHEGTYSCRLTNMAGVYTWLEATVEIRSVPRLPSKSPTAATSTPTHHQFKKNER